MKIEHALAYIKHGWAVFPCVPNSKVPLTRNGFKDASKSEDQVREWWSKNPEANISIATGQISDIAVVDIDVKNGARGRESLNLLDGIIPTLTANTPSGGWHYWYAPPGPIRSRNGLLPGIDFKADGGYVLAPGSEIDGKLYQWVTPNAPIVNLPNSIIQLTKDSRRKASPFGSDDRLTFGTRNDTLASLAGTMRNRGLDYDEILAALLAINTKRCSPPLSDDEVAKIAVSYAKYATRGMTSSPSPTFSEDSFALEFTQRYAQDWKYVAKWNCWLQWVERYWIKEDTYKVYDLSRLICREIAARCSSFTNAVRIASASTVSAVERLARADRKHAANTEQWDCDPWLLNTPGGIVNLRTGEVRPCQREAYMTKITTANAANPGQPSRWLEFLEEVTDGDKDRQAYLSRVAGYCLTGETREHALFFLYGTGANGKSVFLNTLSAIAGDYAANAPIDTFMETRTDRHPTDLAALRGARLVTSIEVENGRRWAEAKIKTLTGGDKVSARFMRQDFFEYQPQFKLLIAGNHKPGLRDVDEAMRRRLHLIPFTVTIPPEKRDKELSEKLLAERDSILAWAIAGCLEWQELGLRPPESVLSATEEYFSDQDTLQRWINEKCIIDNTATAGTTELYASWKVWAEACQEYVGTVRRFSDSISQRGFSKWRQPGGRQGFRGIGLQIP